MCFVNLYDRKAWSSSWPKIAKINMNVQWAISISSG